MEQQQYSDSDGRYEWHSNRNRWRNSHDQLYGKQCMRSCISNSYCERSTARSPSDNRPVDYLCRYVYHLYRCYPRRHMERIERQCDDNRNGPADGDQPRYGYDHLYGDQCVRYLINHKSTGYRSLPDSRYNHGTIVIMCRYNNHVIRPCPWRHMECEQRHSNSIGYRSSNRSNWRH